MSDPSRANQANPHPVSQHRTPGEIAADEAGPIGQPDVDVVAKGVSGAKSPPDPALTSNDVRGRLLGVKPSPKITAGHVQAVDDAAHDTDDEADRREARVPSSAKPIQERAHP